ncbi:hypothetical protein BKA64DRAFT_715346 [Cadophora sp. MPI-SDFR-AT-0126]|nr:hypothetical protein BKA64DRAFT_715346 [Leotiomycetes sp. MPI-SDFR-AT-0126]
MAQRVLIWMPPPIDGDTQAISLIEKIVGLFCEENSISIERLGQVDNFDALREFKVEKLRPIEPVEWKSFFNFYDHTYFTRTWCIREVSASQNALVLYGQTEIDFNLVALAASWFSYESEKFDAIRHMSSDRGIAHAGFMRRKN